jgi:hypothetical protein
VIHYDQPFGPVGLSDWEAVLLQDLTPDTTHADELAATTLKELGKDPDRKS